LRSRFVAAGTAAATEGAGTRRSSAHASRWQDCAPQAPPRRQPTFSILLPNISRNISRQNCCPEVGKRACAAIRDRRLSIADRFDGLTLPWPAVGLAKVATLQRHSTL